MDDETELAMIRRKKMAELIKREKAAKASNERRAKAKAEHSKLLARFLAPDAAQYLEGLKRSEPAIAGRVEELVLNLVVNRGFRQVLKQLDLVYIVRQLKGEGSRIRIQRNGEMTDFSDYVRETTKDSGDNSN
jgi:DNA-binding TFAR19-related protein (PDSD5 family)